MADDTKGTTEAPNMEMLFKVVKNVTLPLLKFDGVTSLYIKITGKIFKADDTRTKAPKEGETPMAAPNLMHVLNHVDNREYQLIVNDVLGSELEKAYPEASYVGKSFKLARNTVQGKRYKTFEIQQIELAAPKAEAPAGKGK